MPAKKRVGQQTPTRSHVMPYRKTHGAEAVDAYEESGRTAQEWQKLLIYDLLAVNEDGLYTHQKFGYSIPRRNGKNEVIVMREVWALEHGERVLHSAHRTTTSTSASQRLAKILDDIGYTEIQRPKKGEIYSKSYTYTKQLGLEGIKILDDGGGVCNFRTRTATGGLGEGYDVVVIDEAQEYTLAQESSLQYVVTDSKNPQMIFCGTPPTSVSKGTVFPKMRDRCLAGQAEDTGWAEWSIEEQSNPRDKELWYKTNPSLGTILTERKIRAELSTDALDFNIQRLGLWLKYSQKSAISAAEWAELRLDEPPEITGKLFLAVKFGRTGENTVLAVAAKLTSNETFVECIGCYPTKVGNQWVIDFFKKVKLSTAIIVLDGANGQSILAEEMKAARLPKAVLPTVAQVIESNAVFERAIAGQTLRHGGQRALANAITNSEKRAIGTNGGFGYRTVAQGAESALIEATVLAFWACEKGKPKKKQAIGY